MRAQAVIFDMDGLLLDSEAVYHRSWTECARAQGYALSDEQYRTFIGQRIAGCEERLAASAGAGFDLARFRAEWRVRWREIAAAGVAPKSGALELLASLAQRHVPLAIATSSARSEALLALGTLAERFAAIVTGDEVANGKPAPDIYLLAASRLGTAPTACVALEDSENGARAAMNAGMPVVIVPDLVQPSPATAAGALAVCRTLHEAAVPVLGLIDG